MSTTRALDRIDVGAVLDGGLESINSGRVIGRSTLDPCGKRAAACQAQIA